MMLPKLSKNSSVKNILVINLTNIGDVLMSCPVIDILRRDFPSAKIHVVVGPKAVSLFEGNKDINVIVFDKHASWFDHICWFLKLRATHYEVVVDLRNTILAFLLMPRYATPLSFGGPFEGHLVDKHLARLKTVYAYEESEAPPSVIQISAADKQYVDGLLASFLAPGEPFIVVAPVAADLAKTWNTKGFAAVVEALINSHGIKVVLVGSALDKELFQQINAPLAVKALDLSGQTNLSQVAEILSRASMALVHDSGIMHIASYLNVPAVALFGPTNPAASAPWSKRWKVVQRNEKCARCLDPKLNLPHNCMSAINPQDVLDAIKGLGF